MDRPGELAEGGRVHRLAGSVPLAGETRVDEQHLPLDAPFAQHPEGHVLSGVGPHPVRGEDDGLEGTWLDGGEDARVWFEGTHGQHDDGPTPGLGPPQSHLHPGEGWTWAGVARPDQIGPWEDSAGVSGGVQAARWVRPRLVTGPEEIRIWRDAGVDDPDEARLMLKHGREPAAVARARAAALALLRRLPGGGDGRVPTCVSSGTGLVTEIYWYAYGYCCVPAAATHWYAIDFAGDREVRASRRDGLVGHPAVERAGGAVNYAVATVAARRLVGQPPGRDGSPAGGRAPREARQAPATTSRRTCSRGPGW